MKTLIFTISGMHCSSCAMNIDGELEDTDGVIESTTNYAAAKTTVSFDEKNISEEKIIAIISGLGYAATR